jgi:hypothetical protein
MHFYLGKRHLLWTVIWRGFRPEVLLSVATLSLSFLFCRRAAQAALSLFPGLPAGASAGAFGGQ